MRIYCTFSHLYLLDLLTRGYSSWIITILLSQFFFCIWCYFPLLYRMSSMLITWLKHFVSFKDDPHLKFSFDTHASFHDCTTILVFIAYSQFIAFLYFLCTKFYQSSHSNVSKDTWAPPPNFLKICLVCYAPKWILSITFLCKKMKHDFNPLVLLNCNKTKMI